MRLPDFINEMEKIAPPELAWEFDNPGLLVSPRNDDLKKIFVALDCTVETAKQAIAFDADLMLTHHPVLFRGVKHITKDDPETAAVWMLLQNGIGLYAAHTNWDSAKGGVNDIIMEKIGITETEPLPPEGLGRIGELSVPMPLKDLAGVVENRFHTVVRVTGDPERIIKRVACVGGSGGSDIQHVVNAGADAYITGEVKHNQAIESVTLNLPMIVAGHFETEYPSMEYMMARLQAISNDVLYKLALSDSSPFWHR